MPTIDDLKKSNFLTKRDIEPAKLVTIESYEEMNVAMEGAEPQMKWVLHFKELDKPLVLNSTNGQIIHSITGATDFDGWIGKKIVLYFEPNVFFGGKMTGGIRVRAPKGSTPPPQSQPEENHRGDDIPF